MDAIGTADDTQVDFLGSTHFHATAAQQVDSSAKVRKAGLRSVPDMLTMRHARIGMLCVMRVQSSTKRISLPLGTLTGKWACNAFQNVDR